MLIDYIPAKECEEILYGSCIKCGKCGRKFDDDGVMIDEGGTTPEDWSEEE